ncbi:hypothetical protein D3C77_522960 [compost metagenome]
MPAGQTQHTVHGPQQKARCRSTYRAGQGHGQEPQAIHLRQVFAREPARQVEQDRRAEAGLHHADQKTQEIQGVLGIGKHQRSGRQAPRNHDPADPCRCPIALQAQAAGYFEQHVADEEHARGQAVGSIAEAQFLLHLCLRKTDVDAIEVGEQEADDSQRHDAPGHTAV